MSDQRSGFNVWPFVLGFLAGAVAGVLFAPAKGTESRRRLRRKTHELKERVGPGLTEISRKVEPVFRKIDEFGNVLKEELAEGLEEEDLGLTPDPAALASEAVIKNPSLIVPKPKKRAFFHNARR